MTHENHAAELIRPDLHSQIMNLPVVQAYIEHHNRQYQAAYKIGHRDARHAAAGLVATELERREAEVGTLADLLRIVLSKCAMPESLRDNIAAALSEVKHGE